MAADLTDYVDLRPWDRDSAGLVDRALADAEVKLPDWTPREGHTEMVLIEATALEVAELVYAINRLPAAVVEALLRLYGVTRDPGAPPQVTITFALSDALGHTIPAGTRVHLTIGDNGYTFTTDADATVSAGPTTVDVIATGTASTSAVNDIAGGTPVAIIDPLLAVDSAEIASIETAGRDAEDGRAWLNRGAQRFARLNDALLLPAHFTARALEDPAVARATTIDLYDPGTGPDPGDNPGHVTVGVAGPAGTAVSTGDKNDLLAAMVEQASAHLEIHIIDATVTNVNVTFEVVNQTGWTDSEVLASVTAALDAYLNPDAWGWGATVYRNELISVIDQAAGVDRVVAITVPATDFALTGDAPLANLGTVVMT